MSSRLTKFRGVRNCVDICLLQAAVRANVESPTTRWRTDDEQCLGKMPCRGRVPALNPTLAAAANGALSQLDHSEPASEPKSFIPLALIAALPAQRQVVPGAYQQS